MSIVNRMLQDLDKRRASTDERKGLPDTLRSLPPAQQTRDTLNSGVALGVAGVLGLGLMLWVVTGGNIGFHSTPPVLSVPSVPVSPAAAPLPENHPGAPVPDATTSAPPPSSLELKTATELAALPAHPPRRVSSADLPAQKETAKETAKDAAKDMPSRREASTSASGASGEIRRSAPGTLTDSSVTAPGIEKQARPLSPREKADLQMRRAQEAQARGQTDEALAAYQAALQEDPTHANARLAAAKLLTTQKRRDEAAALLREGLAQSGAPAEVPLAVARLEVDRGDLAAAVDVMRKYQPATGHPGYRAYLAGVLQRAGRHAEAIEEYQYSLRLSPQSGIWWLGLGLSYEALGRGSEATDAFQRARDSGTLAPDLMSFVEQKIKR